MTTPLQQYLQEVKSGKIDLISYVEEALQKIEELNHKYHFFTTICRERALQQAQEVQRKLKHHQLKHRHAGGECGGLKLGGLLISVKDNICVKGVESTAGSRILQGYKPLFNATAIERLEKEGAIVLGKTNQDEFGFGSFNTNVGLDKKVPLNPLDCNRTTGGSSGGAAGITALADFAHIAIAESTGGSIEAPAAFCGVVGFCPTYGKISRYGLISFADSLDKIGLMSKNAADILPVLEVMSGFDEMDGTSLAGEKLNESGDSKEFGKESNRQELNSNEAKKKIKSIGIIKESFAPTVAPEIQAALQKVVDKLRQQGFDVAEVSLPLTLQYGIPTYYLLSTAEASTNLARFCGLRYGQESSVKGKSFSDYFSEIRSQHFNEESKRRIILGTFARMAGYRDAYYLKAAKIRTLIIEEYQKMFERYDVLISPTMPIIAPTFEEIKKLSPLQHYFMDILTVGPNLAGIPHASLPLKITAHKPFGQMPVGLMAMTNHLEEQKLCQFLLMAEELVDETKKSKKCVENENCEEK